MFATLSLSPHRRPLSLLPPPLSPLTPPLQLPQSLPPGARAERSDGRALSSNAQASPSAIYPHASTPPDREPSPACESLDHAQLEAEARVRIGGDKRIPLRIIRVPDVILDVGVDPFGHAQRQACIVAWRRERREQPHADNGTVERVQAEAALASGVGDEAVGAQRMQMCGTVLHHVGGVDLRCCVEWAEAPAPGGILHRGNERDPRALRQPRWRLREELDVKRCAERCWCCGGTSSSSSADGEAQPDGLGSAVLGVDSLGKRRLRCKFACVRLCCAAVDLSGGRLVPQRLDRWCNLLVLRLGIDHVGLHEVVAPGVRRVWHAAPISVVLVEIDKILRRERLVSVLTERRLLGCPSMASFERRDRGIGAKSHAHAVAGEHLGWVDRQHEAVSPKRCCRRLGWAKSVQRGLHLGSECHVGRLARRSERANCVGQVASLLEPRRDGQPIVWLVDGSLQLRICPVLVVTKVPCRVLTPCVLRNLGQEAVEASHCDRVRITLAETHTPRTQPTHLAKVNILEWV
mmetsp:Transcript_57926/g.159103  ORF Transcript_57926/g.159103 Transcript_57926/m.159103 type:complete len:520 (+) Transcript_57926:15-1574(+)